MTPLGGKFSSCHERMRSRAETGTRIDLSFYSFKISKRSDNRPRPQVNPLSCIPPAAEIHDFYLEKETGSF